MWKEHIRLTDGDTFRVPWSIISSPEPLKIYTTGDAPPTNVCGVLMLALRAKSDTCCHTLTLVSDEVEIRCVGRD